MCLHPILRFAFFSTVALALIPTLLPVSQSSDFNDLEEESRRALLSYYNSQTMTHGGYMIALTLGFLTLISRWKNFVGRGKKWWKIAISCRWMIFILIISLVLASGVYLALRLFHWGYLASNVLYAQLDEDDWHYYGSTVMHALHNKTAEQKREGFNLRYGAFLFGLEPEFENMPSLLLIYGVIAFIPLFFLSWWLGPLNPTYQLNDKRLAKNESKSSS